MVSTREFASAKEQCSPSASGWRRLAAWWSGEVLFDASTIAMATFGAVGGLLAGSGQVVRMGGVYNPMHLPVLSLLVKIQMGALCGLAGVLAAHLLTQVIDRKVNALVASEPRDHAVRK
jgi:hypothetical protein